MALNGIPNLLRKLPQSVVISVLGNSASSIWKYLFPGPQWGIFLPGSSNRAIEVSSVVSMSIAGTSRASDYPIQNGSFTSYNKVRMPDVFSVVVTCDGNEQVRSLFLTWLKDNCSATTLFDVVCPEMRWGSSTLTDYRIDRTSESGASMITAECIFQQIRQLPISFENDNITNPENKGRIGTVTIEPIINLPDVVVEDVKWR